MEAITFAALVVIFTVFLLLSQTHFIHETLGTRNCSRRTDTRAQSVFHQARKPSEEVIFDFTRGDPRSVDVTIPVGSNWVNLRTFHVKESSCIKIVTLDGWTSLYYQSLFYGSASIRDGKGSEWPQLPLEYLEWRRDGLQLPESRSVVRLVDNAQLWRTQCSVIQDAELYFSLCTTPLWIRTLFSLASWVPGSHGVALRDKIINAVLYIQLRTTYYKNDNWTYQGRIRIDWYWWTTPQWVWTFQGQTEVVISRAVLGLCYWTGRLLLSLRPHYEEYDMVFDYDTAKNAVEKD